MKDREGDGNLDNRIFVGGLSWDVTERQLQDTFHRYGKIIECQIMVGKDTGRPRGFGFITFTDRRGADDAIKHMHGRELGDRVISVNKAEPKAGGEDVDHLRKSGRGAGEDECFKCGRHGHSARECPSSGGDRGRYRDPPPVRSRIGSYDGHRDRYEVERDRYMDGRRDGGRYNDRDRYEDGHKYEARDLYAMERYGPRGHRLVSDRYRMPEHHHLLEDDYRRGERGYDRERYARGASDRYGDMGPLRDEGRAYRSRRGPYDRPSRAGGRSSSHERW
ncbi:unnamed protein product [Eruca vesicaria subsp. sativa]|uniref:Uncharacterized protein n=1 Tax=Eruca vesicaria subsp. sativa TaxID=29727 RepID=A0ABC8J1S6_ERUVS|nr:unnamed protein product [Eruca vesicaria subsp. sativa]